MNTTNSNPIGATKAKELAIANPFVKQKLNDGFQIITWHTYYDESGKELFLRIRMKHPETGEKIIRPIRWNESSIEFSEPDWEGVGFLNGKPLYNLHLLSKSNALVIVVEGEQVADVLNEKFKAWGCAEKFVAITSGGATSAGAADFSPISGRHVIIWADNDEAGLKYRESVTTILAAKGCTVEWIAIAELSLSEKEDAYDWLSQNPQATLDEFRSLAKEAPPDELVKQQKSLADFLVKAGDLMKLSLPELEYVIYPFIPAQALAMIFAKRGVGKTWYALEMAISIAMGKQFLAWEVPKKRRVLYIDGEMPLVSLQYRLKQLCLDEYPELLDILPSEQLWREGQSINLNDEDDLDRIDEFLSELAGQGRAPECIFIDNISSMSSGIDENGNSEMDTMLRWLIKLRSRGFAVVLVHHAGKNGDQRGGSRREDFLDTSIKLTDSNGSDGAKVTGANFQVEFVKVRGIRPTPDRLGVQLAATEHVGLKWVTSKGESILPAYLETLRIIRDAKPQSQAKLAIQLGISASAISQQLKTAREKGLLASHGLELTKKGLEEVDKHFTNFDTGL